MAYNETYKETSGIHTVAYNAVEKATDNETKQKVVTRTETEVDFYTFRNTWLVCELAFREILSDEKIEQTD